MDNFGIPHVRHDTISVKTPSYPFLASNHTSKTSRLFEDLAGGVLVLLAVVDNGLVPSPLGLDKSLVFGVAGVQLGEVVALVVGSHVEDRFVVITTDDEGTLND